MISRGRERERERAKSGRQEGGFTLLILTLHKQTKILILTHLAYRANGNTL